MKIKEILLSTSNTAAFIPLRLGVGIVMAAHGSQKLFGWFGGHGLQGTGKFFAENLGLEPGVLMAAMAGGTQFFGGLLLLAGLATRPAALGIAGTMAVAILTAHRDAFFASNGGMEFPLTLLLASLTLLIGGAGKFSVDQKLS